MQTLNGVIDEVLVYDRALTATEISQLAGGGTTAAVRVTLPDANTVRLYNLSPQAYATKAVVTR